MKKIIVLVTIISILAISVLPSFALSATPDSGKLDDYEHDIWFPTDAEGVRDYWLDWVNKCKADDEDIIDNFVFIVLIDEQIDKAKDFTPESFPGMDVKEVFWNKYITKENTGGFPWAPIGSRATIVDLILNRHDKNNVIRVIEELNRRDDIYLALCDFEWHADGATQDTAENPTEKSNVQITDTSKISRKTGDPYCGYDVILPLAMILLAVVGIISMYSFIKKKG